MSATLNKQEIFELITAFADGEATAEESRKVSGILKDYPEYQKFLTSERRTKQLIHQCCCSKKASKKLYNRCLEAIARDVPYSGITKSCVTSDAASTPPVIENLAYEHFRSDGSVCELIPMIRLSNTEAQDVLKHKHQLIVTVPELKGCHFCGFEILTPVSGTRIAVLYYNLSATRQGIQVMSFNVPVKGSTRAEGKREPILRNPEAVKACLRREDVYMARINDKDIVSWLWDDAWYTAISNLHGETVAAILPVAGKGP